MGPATAPGVQIHHPPPMIQEPRGLRTPCPTRTAPQNISRRVISGENAVAGFFGGCSSCTDSNYRFCGAQRAMTSRTWTIRLRRSTATQPTPRDDLELGIFVRGGDGSLNVDGEPTS